MTKTKKIAVCKFCNKPGHYKTFCPFKPRKPIKVDTVIKKRKIKTSRQKLKKELERLVKDYIKKRDNYTCQKCGKSVAGASCQASHVIPVSRSANLQFDPLNMKVLCTGCHLYWWHKAPLEASDWFRKKFPDRWLYLEDKYQQPVVPVKEYQLQELIDEYRNKLKS